MMAVCAVVGAAWFWPHPLRGTNPSPPDWAANVLRDRQQLTRQAHGGDRDAAHKLVTALLFDNQEEAAVSVLRDYLVNRSDTEVESELGVLLIDSTLRQSRDGLKINTATQSEGLALLRLASVKGDKKATDAIQIFSSVPRSK
jgi:hypothetical protein